MKKVFFIALLVLQNAIAFAQETNNKVEMADTMRSNGKIYVVVAVLLIIFAGIIIYLINIDRKIGKLEGEEKNQIKN